MRTGFDSAYPPTVSQIQAAKAAGISAWSGYFPGPGILNGWSEQNFHDVMNGGLGTSAYCSGWADPVAMETQRVSWGVPRIILDDESGIRSVATHTQFEFSAGENRRLARSMMHTVGGLIRPVLEQKNGVWTVSSWVQPWLNASGAGQYGNEPVFAGVVASCYVFAAYPGGDPGLSWPTYYPRPSGGPCGWQFQGTHSFSGIGVDSTHYDDDFWAFGPKPGEEEMLTVGPFHPLKATLKSYVTGSYYAEPFSSMVAGTFNNGATITTDGYRFSSTPVQSTTPPGPDSVWWHATTGGWVPDAILNTIGVAGAPGMTIPKTEPIESIYIPGSGGFPGLYLPVVQSGGLTMVQVDAEIASKLVDYPTNAKVAQAIVDAISTIPAAKAGPHHHGVLGLINTGPVIPDPS